MNRSTRKTINVAAIICLVAALAIGVHQFVIWGYWFEMKDFLHHENFMVVAVVIAVMLLAIAAKR